MADPAPVDTQPTAPQPHYTRSVLLQLLVVFGVLAAVIVWQGDVVWEIYLANQINAIGWVVNGGILALFSCGLGMLVWRFFEYRREEAGISRFLHNLNRSDDPMLGMDENCMVAVRYRTLQELNRRRAHINQNALAATLLAAESSRNTFPKFVHNVLILIGVFGTIISLSLSLLGASDLLTAGSLGTGGAGGGLGTMIFGMSTALSTTMTAILAYLIFGYFYLKLTDTQTYLVSRIEEVTATALLPHLQLNPDAVIKDYSDSIRSAGKLIDRLDQAQQHYEASAQSLRNAAEALSAQLDTTPDMAALRARSDELQQAAAAENQKLLAEVIHLLQEGFRLQK